MGKWNCFYLWAVLMSLMGSQISYGKLDLSKVILDVEPVFGFEFMKKDRPTAHLASRLTYGVRIVAGYEMVALEVEYDRGTDTEVFVSDNLQTHDSTDRLKIGARYIFTLSEMKTMELSLPVRAGAEARRLKHEEGPLVGPFTGTWGDVTYSPYLGAGLNLSLLGSFAVHGSFVVVFNDFPSMASNDYQTTFGITWRPLKI